MTEEGDRIIVYGAGWCPDVLMTRAFLDRHRIAYEYRDIDRGEGVMDALLALRGKAWVVPTLVLPDGTILDNPSRRDLARILGV
ncbi:MAG: NrdH-redoxin [Anaerolineae bacterium]|jgi:mycoredoxin|nr:NrdH-redoxin [Anaerolineae bacterium]